MDTTGQTDEIDEIDEPDETDEVDATDAPTPRKGTRSAVSRADKCHHIFQGGVR